MAAEAEGDGSSRRERELSRHPSQRPPEYTAEGAGEIRRLLAGWQNKKTEAQSSHGVAAPDDANDGGI